MATGRGPSTSPRPNYFDIFTHESDASPCHTLSNTSYDMMSWSNMINGYHQTWNTHQWLWKSCYNQVWSSLIKSDQVWSSLIKTHHFCWSNSPRFSVKTPHPLLPRRLLPWLLRNLRPRWQPMGPRSGWWMEHGMYATTWAIFLGDFNGLMDSKHQKVLFF